MGERLLGFATEPEPKGLVEPSDPLRLLCALCLSSDEWNESSVPAVSVYLPGAVCQRSPRQKRFHHGRTWEDGQGWRTRLSTRQSTLRRTSNLTRQRLTPSTGSISAPKPRHPHLPPPPYAALAVPHILRATSTRS